MLQVTDDLRDQLGPVNSAMKQVLKERDDRARAAKRHRGQKSGANIEETEAARRAEEKVRIDNVIASQAVDPSLVGPNPSAIYELCGWSCRPTALDDMLILGLVTHKGPSADSGESFLSTCPRHPRVKVAYCPLPLVGWPAVSRTDNKRPLYRVD